MKEQIVYIGNGSEKGIYLYQLKNEKMEWVKNTDDCKRCTYITGDSKYIYGVLENEKGYMISYKKDYNDLKFIGKYSSYGKGPCHIELDKKNNFLLISNYIDGACTILKLKQDGKVDKKIFNNIQNINISRLHCIKKLEKYNVYISIDLGMNALIAYEFKDEIIKKIAEFYFKNDVQPRHFISIKEKLYVVTEKSCEVYILEFKNNNFKLLNRISLLPDGIEKKEYFTGCAIKISRNCKKIYTTIRGHDSISVFKIRKGNLKMIQNISTRGHLPWDIALDKKEKYILVANNGSNDIAIFKNNIFNKLKFLYKKEVESPTCIFI